MVRESQKPKLRPSVRAAITEYVQRAAEQFSDELLAITLFGSQARGDARSDSDVDLFVLVRRDTPAVREALADLAWRVQFAHDLTLTVIVRSRDLLQASPVGRFPLYQNIEREGIELWKRPSEPTPSYAKPGLIKPEFARLYFRARRLREEADYAEDAQIDETGARQTLQECTRFVDRLQRFLADVGALPPISPP